MKELAKAYATVFFLLGLFVGAVTAVAFTHEETRKKVKKHFNKAQTHFNATKTDLAQKVKQEVKEKLN